MVDNSNLHMIRDRKIDEFYTQNFTIEDELWRYRKYFKDFGAKDRNKYDVLKMQRKKV